MQISVTVEDIESVDLTTPIETRHRYDEDGDREHRRTGPARKAQHDRRHVLIDPAPNHVVGGEYDHSQKRDEVRRRAGARRFDRRRRESQIGVSSSAWRRG